MDNKKRKVNLIFSDILFVNIVVILTFILSVVLLICFFHRKLNEDTIHREEIVQQIFPSEEKIKYENLINEYEKTIADKDAQITMLGEEIRRYEVKDSLTGAEWEFLYRIAVAEAGYSSPQGQINVVCVVLNRVFSEKYPNDIISVISDPGQFTAYPNLFNAAIIDDSIREAVFEAVYNYENYNAEGALRFNKDSSVPYLFKDEVGHYFRR